MMTSANIKKLYPDAEVFIYEFNRTLDNLLLALFEGPMEKQSLQATPISIYIPLPRRAFYFDFPSRFRAACSRPVRLAGGFAVPGIWRLAQRAISASSGNRSSPMEVSS